MKLVLQIAPLKITKIQFLRIAVDGASIDVLLLGGVLSAIFNPLAIVSVQCTSVSDPDDFTDIPTLIERLFAKQTIPVSCLFTGHPSRQRWRSTSASSSLSGSPRPTSTWRKKSMRLALPTPRKSQRFAAPTLYASSAKATFVQSTRVQRFLKTI